MSDITNKEWETGDIIEATDLNAITPFMCSIAYNQTEDWDETSATVQEIMDGLVAHNLGFVIAIDSEYYVYNCLIVINVGYDERGGQYTMTLYGSLSGSIDTIQMSASSADEKFHTASYS